MSTSQHSQHAAINGIDMHYLDYDNAGTPLILLHSLSANAQVFNGLYTRGLADYFRIITPDLRGRGRTEQPLFGYTLEQQAKDVIALLDHLGLAKAAVCGHSFGGFLAIYIAANYPERASKLIVLDAGIALNPLTIFLISYSSARLFSIHPSWDIFISMVRKAPFMDRWDAAMLPFLKEDVKLLPNGMLLPSSNWMHVMRAGTNIVTITESEWRKMVASVQCPMLLLYAADPYAHGQYILPKNKAKETIAAARYGEDGEIEGNHFTMLFAQGAGQIVSRLQAFAAAEKPAENAAAMARLPVLS